MYPSATEVVDHYEGEQETLDLQSSTGDNSGEMILMTMTVKMVKKIVGDEQVLGFQDSKMCQECIKGVTEEQMVNTEVSIMSVFLAFSGLCLLAKWPVHSVPGYKEAHPW